MRNPLLLPSDFSALWVSPADVQVVGGYRVEGCKQRSRAVCMHTSQASMQVCTTAVARRCCTKAHKAGIRDRLGSGPQVAQSGRTATSMLIEMSHRNLCRTTMARWLQSLQVLGVRIGIRVRARTSFKPGSDSKYNREC